MCAKYGVLATLTIICSFAMAQPRISVSSKDGVPISVIKLGSGPPMVLVHGSGSVGLSWAAVMPELSRQFTLYAMDRRGRGQSGDGPQYSIQSEMDDIAAVVATAGQPVTLVAHSYGAFLTVAAAQAGELKNISRLILYEPPGSDKPRPELVERIQNMKRAAEVGDKDRVVALFLAGALGPQVFNSLQASPSWATVGPAMAAMAGTLLRESEAVNDFRFSAPALAKWTVPTTMLLGDQSPDNMRTAAQFVCGSMANCKLVMLEGQGHLAAQLAPGLFVKKVVEPLGQ